MRITHVILLLIFLFTGLFKIYAQDNLIVNPARMDSIRHLVESHKKADEEKVRLLNEYARFCFYNEEYFDGFNSTIEACDLAKQLDFKGGEIMYHYTLATFFAYGEIYFYHIQKAKILSNDENDKHISEAIMPVSYKPEATPERIKKLTPVYNHFKKIGEKEIEASILDQLSWGFYNSGDLVKTRECLEELIRIFKELNEIYPVVVYSSYLNNLANSDNDTARIESLNKEIAEAISRITQKEVLGPLNYQLANFYSYGGQSQLALKHYLNSLDYFESVHDTTMLADVYVHMHDLYAQLEMNSQALEARENQILMLEKLGDSANTKSAQGLLVWDYYHAQRYKEATMTVQKLKENSSTQAERESYSILSTGLEGQILMKLGNYKEAITPLKDRFEKSDQWSKPWGALYLAICYLGEKDYDTALRFAVSAIDYSKEIGRNDIFNRQIYQVTSEIYDALGNESMAYHYLKLYHDVVSDQNESNQVVETMLSSAVEKSQKQIDRLEEERALTEQQNKIQRLWIFSVAGALLSVLFLALILYRNNKNKQKANQLLQEQKEEIETQKKNVEETLTELKTTQNQLIQSEKMASLGELTAGIAHEIQNPLNFVNNFSEVSNELVDEMNEELNNGDLEEAKAISSDIKQNLEKINYHGKRADSIVKGMLLHSRGNTGQKELTDINALADEYLRLSYHGFRAKDKSFNADFKLETNESLPKIEVVPQEIGRVLLNLINNAFYAVNEKVKHGANSYKPLVVVQTIRNGNGIEICVKDNGSGIPESVKEKIFQPFFTTKPTGQGTGLGLSLSYDIVKAHGGELSLYSINENQTTENESGTTFSIILPTTEKTTE